jgi:hypothetical protein
MIVLKITQTADGPAILLSPEALELLGASVGEQVSFSVSETGELTIGPQDMSFEARRERGRAFLKRYDKTFKALAK